MDSERAGRPGTNDDSRAPSHWYQPIAEFLGDAYLRNAFTFGTAQEIDFLTGELGFGDAAAGDDVRILDAGCGPGRHSLELARRGHTVDGIDIAPRFVELAAQAACSEGLDRRARFWVADIADLNVEGRYRAVTCLCQGGFGLTQTPGALGADAAAGMFGPGPDTEHADAETAGATGVPVRETNADADARILAALARALVPGGRLALTAFNAFFAASGLWDGEHQFDIATETFYEIAELCDGEGRTLDAPMATSCYTPRELRLLAGACGLRVDAIYGVEPGAYAASTPTAGHAELLLIAERPG